MKYSWAANPLKLQRAEAANPGQSEEAIKEAYKKLGGKVLNEAEVELVVEKPVETLEINQPGDDELPKKKTAKSALAIAKAKRLASIP